MGWCSSIQFVRFINLAISSPSQLEFESVHQHTYRLMSGRNHDVFVPTSCQKNQLQIMTMTDIPTACAWHSLVSADWTQCSLVNPKALPTGSLVGTVLIRYIPFSNIYIYIYICRYLHMYIQTYNAFNFLWSHGSIVVSWRWTLLSWLRGCCSNIKAGLEWDVFT